MCSLQSPLLKTTIMGLSACTYTIHIYIIRHIHIHTHTHTRTRTPQIDTTFLQRICQHIVCVLLLMLLLLLLHSVYPVRSAVVELSRSIVSHIINKHEKLQLIKYSTTLKKIISKKQQRMIKQSPSTMTTKRKRRRITRRRMMDLQISQIQSRRYILSLPS